MPRRGRDGRARRGGAGLSVIEETADATALVRLLPMTVAEREAERRTRRLDFDHFREHPTCTSYVRPYHAGELPALLTTGQPLGEPSHVAVALVHPTERTRVFIWPGHVHAFARRAVEEVAERERSRLGLRGDA